MARILTLIFFLTAIGCAAQKPSGIHYSVLVDTREDVMTLVVDLKSTETNVNLYDVICTLAYYDKEKKQIGTDRLPFTDDSLKFLAATQVYKKNYPIKNMMAYYIKGTSVRYKYKVNGNWASATSSPDSADEYAAVNSENFVPHREIEGYAGGAHFSIVYGQEFVKGRNPFQNTLPIGKIWVPGRIVNEGTTITFDRDVLLDGRPLKQGSYKVAIEVHNEKQATLMLYSDQGQWGAFRFDPNKAEPILKDDISIQKAPYFAGELLYSIDPKGRVSLSYGNFQLTFTVKR
jgi:hypothetical protein